MTRRKIFKMMLCTAFEFQKIKLADRHPSGIKTSLNTAGISSPPQTGYVVDPRPGKKGKDEEAEDR